MKTEFKQEHIAELNPNSQTDDKNKDCWERNCIRQIKRNQIGFFSKSRKKTKWDARLARNADRKRFGAVNPVARHGYILHMREVSTEKRFIEIAQAWKNETAVYSLAAKKITNKHYMTIIGMGMTLGDPIVKLILKDLKKGQDYWHFALKTITNQNPVPKEYISNLKKIRQFWLEWGKQNNKI